MATFYVDKRVAVNGNGSQASPFKRIDEVCSPTIGTNAVIEIVAGSGPYIYGVDFGYLSQSNLYLNHSGLGTITWNFNGNVITSEVQLINNPLYEWHKSNYDSSMYYCTGIGGANPNFLIVKSGIVNGYWDAASTSIFDVYSHVTDITHPQKWGWGNKDSLGFSTVYVRNINPNDLSNSVLISQYPKQLIQADAVTNPANEIFNDVEIRGGGSYGVRIGTPITTTFNRCKFENTDDYAVYLTNSSGQCFYNYCYFKNNGHQSFACSNGDQTAINCFFEKSHTITKMVSSTEVNTITIINCKTKNMLAGCIQFNTASTQTFVENNNQWHVDPIGSVLHGGDIGIAFAVAGRKWATTDSTDFPPSQATNTQIYASPESVPEGAGAAITGLHDQAIAAKDYNGNDVLFLSPNIGHIDSRTTKIISSDNYTPTGYDVRSPASLVITGGGTVDLSGLTDNGKIDVYTTTYSSINSFAGNGSETTIKSKYDVRNNRDIGSYIK